MKNWILNIAIALAGAGVLLWLLFMWFGWFTNHGVSVDVPNIKGMRIDKAEEILNQAGLRYQVTDSIYSEEFKRMSITEQDPVAGAKVKPGRIIYLVVNSLSKPMVKMPQCVGHSLSLATAILKNAGLELEDVSYKYDEIGANLVLAQIYRGDTIAFNRPIVKGSKISLVVSKNVKETDSTATELMDPVLPE